MEGKNSESGDMPGRIRGRMGKSDLLLKIVGTS